MWTLFNEPWDLGRGGRRRDGTVGERGGGSRGKGQQQQQQQGGEEIERDVEKERKLEDLEKEKRNDEE